MNERTYSDDDIRALLIEAGPAPELPVEDLETIRRAARREWLGKSVTPIFEGRSYRNVLALAASLLIVLGAVWYFRSSSSPLAGAPLATIELVRAEAGTRPRFAQGDELSRGNELTTVPTERLALRMASGHSVRLDTNSRVRFASASRLELEYGALYVDSGPNGASRGLEVSTPLGTVREIGTQYEVRVNGTMRVRVREGSISLSHGGGTESAARGEQLVVDLVGEVDRSIVPIAGPEWAWVLDVAPIPEVEEQSLGAYLDWLSRETGRPVRYAEPELEAFANETIYGDIRRLTAEQSLGVVLASRGLDHRIEDGVLVIFRTNGR